MADKPTAEKLWEADTRVSGNCEGNPVDWHVPEETPVAIVYGGTNHVVMLASPGDLYDFATGFSVTEGIVRCPSEIRHIELREKAKGIDLLISLSDEAMERFTIRRDRRNMVGRTGCGLCGIDSMESLYEAVKAVADSPVRLEPLSVMHAVTDFQSQQPLKQLTKSVHGAAWVQADGTVMLVREDVGRHNALDKLIGALMRSGADLTDGFVLVSSRASYEMVQKNLAVGIRAMVSLSAPTAFAIRMAREANFTLANWSKSGLVTF